MRKGADDSPISDTEAGELFGALTGLPALVLAVSGGPDSTALMWLAARWRNALDRPPKLVAVTIDHALRKESATEASAVAKLARKLGIAHRTLRWRGKKPKTGIQAAAREVRYRLLAEAARKAGAEHILTAHTLDDQAETVLFRLVRGSGIGGLAGMASLADLPMHGADGIRLVRPLLALPKARLLATLDAARVPYADDPSNRDPRFTRARIRELMPALAAEGLDARRLSAFARRMRRAEAALERAAEDARARIGRDPGMLDAHQYATLPAELALRLLGQLVAEAGHEGPVELGKLEVLHAAIAEGLLTKTRVRRTLAGAVVTLGDGRIAVERAPPRRTRHSGAKTGGSGHKRAFTKVG